MSASEEPPVKVEVSQEMDEDVEMLDEGQEEWLSEEAYTDEDYHISTADRDTQESPKKTDTKHKGTQENPEGNIEKTLNNFDGDKEEGEELLVRRTNKPADNVKEELKMEKDDGNDTDDLLRILGEEENKAKKKLLKVKDRKSEIKHNSSDDDDDNFVYEGTKISRIRMTKNALLNKYTATKAEPEDTSDGDDESEQSSDNESSSAKKKYPVKRSNVAAKSTSKPPMGNLQRKSTTKQAANMHTQSKNKQTNNTKSILKTPKSEVPKKTAVSFKSIKSDSKVDFDDASNIDEEEFLDDSEFYINEEEFAEDSDLDVGKFKQRLQRPERMEEEVPSDGDSRSEDGSLYDELPSSDSDELEDWFNIDIRGERAGDYLPLLGSKAYDLLSSERRRVKERLATLRESLTSLTESGRKQAEELREATMSLAELDDMLKAS